MPPFVLLNYNFLEATEQKSHQEICAWELVIVCRKVFQIVGKEQLQQTDGRRKITVGQRTHEKLKGDTVKVDYYLCGRISSQGRFMVVSDEKEYRKDFREVQGGDSSMPVG